MEQIKAKLNRQININLLSTNQRISVGTLVYDYAADSSSTDFLVDSPPLGSYRCMSFGQIAATTVGIWGAIDVYPGLEVDCNIHDRYAGGLINGR